MADFSWYVDPSTGSSYWTDGCSGFIEKFGSHELTGCCAVHDNGGTNGALLDCWTQNDTSGYGVGVGFAFALLVMMIFRPIYELWNNRVRPWIVNAWSHLTRR